MPLAIMSPLLLTSLHVYFYKACLERKKKNEKWFPFLILYAFQLPCYQPGKYVGTLSIFTGTVCSLILNSKPKKRFKEPEFNQSFIFFLERKIFMNACLQYLFVMSFNVKSSYSLPFVALKYIFYLLEKILNFRPP